jgi:hypothetical protein
VVTVARWQPWAGDGLEHLVLHEGPHGVVADSVVITADFAARYRIACDAAWRTRRLDVSLIGAERSLTLTGDHDGRWTDAAGAAMPELHGAIDVDITVTPFTNTLPLRRLRLETGQSAEILTVYVRVPELTVEPERQRYTCLERGGRYRFESVDGEFTRDLEVDERGLVVVYPGLFRRLRVT